jgi:Flp pilus assembly protein TadD
MNNFREAVSDYTKVLAIDESNEHALHNRMISYEKMGDFTRAKLDFAKLK